MEQYTFTMTLAWLLTLLYTMATMADPNLQEYKSPRAWVLAAISTIMALWGASVL